MTGDVPLYLAPKSGYYHPPLERFLPPMPIGIFSEWVSENTQPGDVVIDPLGANPLLAVEVAASDRQILFSRNNPILWLIIEVLAAAPQAEDFQDVLNRLLITRREEQTLGDHLSSLYKTRCAECGQLIDADGFIWEQGAHRPTSRQYDCPHCHDRGERPVDAFDIENLQRLGNLGLHRIRAFQRVLQAGDYEKTSINNALNCYLPRALYVIMTLINRVDGMDLSKNERRLLQALLLHVFDDGNALWHWPQKSHRFLQLAVPARFFEKNLWRSLNTGSWLWMLNNKPLCITYWPNLPENGGGVCLYQRRLAEQKDIFSHNRISAVTINFPRPNQAFWTLSALWSGWLWGQKAVVPMRSALARRHYNWHWYAQAIQTTISSIIRQAVRPIKAFGILPQISANHFFGMLSGMQTGGFSLTGMTIKLKEETAQCHWVSGKSTPRHTQDLDLSQTMIEFLEAQGEPLGFDRILYHVLGTMALQGFLPPQMDQIEDSLFRELQEKIAALLNDEHHFRKYSASPTGASLWWLADIKSWPQPLSERVESFILRLLQDKKTVKMFEVEQGISQAFSGIVMPDEDLLTFCLESYADPIGTEDRSYALAVGEKDDSRKRDLEDVMQILRTQGERFGLRVAVKDQFVNWIADSELVVLKYYVSMTAALAQAVLDQPAIEGCKNIIVFPASRSRLIEYRLRSDPRLSEAIEKSWQLLKFRYLRWMNKRENLTLYMWNDLLGGDPPAWDPPKQLQFF